MRKKTKPADTEQPEVGESGGIFHYGGIILSVRVPRGYKLPEGMITEIDSMAKHFRERVCHLVGCGVNEMKTFPSAYPHFCNVKKSLYLDDE